MKASRDGDRALSRVALALACLYAPYAWLVLIDHPWDSYRWHWIRMWPVLPGLLVHAIHLGGSLAARPAGLPGHGWGHGTDHHPDPPGDPPEPASGPDHGGGGGPALRRECLDCLPTFPGLSRRGGEQAAP